MSHSHSKQEDGQEHHHGHSHVPADFSRAFLIGIILNIAFVVVELVFGLLANSIALVADAGHNFSDVLGLVLAWWASALGKRAPTHQRTYGFKRASILAALANAALLLAALGAIAWEAIQRFSRPEPVQTGTMMWVAAVGIVINSLTAIMFMSGRKSDLNIRGAFLHMVADAAITVGVVLAGVVIWRTGWQWLDPTVSLAIVVVIFWGTLGLAKDSLRMAMDFVPRHVDVHAVEDYLLSLPGVTNVHDLHIWGMSTTETALTAHLVRSDINVPEGFYAELEEHLHERYGIDHPTVQIEPGTPNARCRLHEQDGQKKVPWVRSVRNATVRAGIRAGTESEG